MFDADDTYAQAISRSLKTDCRDYEAIDRAFRADTPLAIVNEAHPIRNQLALARTVPRQAVQKMRLSVGEIRYRDVLLDAQETVVTMAQSIGRSTSPTRFASLV